MTVNIHIYVMDSIYPNFRQRDNNMWN